MAKMDQRRGELVAARGRRFVRFYRPFEAGSGINGHVIDVGPKFFLLALLDDEICYNGFQCLRSQDVRRFEAPAKYSSFYAAALAKRRQKLPRKPRVKLDSIESILLTASRCFPLITIHREKIDPGVCHIGQVVAVTASRVALLEIGPDAVWDTEPTTYKTREITRVDFGGGYEEALVLVGGLPPA